MSAFPEQSRHIRHNLLCSADPNKKSPIIYGCVCYRCNLLPGLRHLDYLQRKVPSYACHNAPPRLHNRPQHSSIPEVGCPGFHQVASSAVVNLETCIVDLAEAVARPRTPKIPSRGPVHSNSVNPIKATVKGPPRVGRPNSFSPYGQRLWPVVLPCPKTPCSRGQLPCGVYMAGFLASDPSCMMRVRTKKSLLTAPVKPPTRSTPRKSRVGDAFAPSHQMMRVADQYTYSIMGTCQLILAKSCWLIKIESTHRHRSTSPVRPSSMSGTRSLSGSGAGSYASCRG